MKYKLIHLSRVAALSLAAICVPCLRAQEHEPRNFEVNTPAALYTDETRNIKWDGLTSDIPGDILDTPIPQVPPPPPPPPPPLSVSSSGWGCDVFAYWANDIYGGATVNIYGGQPPYTVTIESQPLYKIASDEFNYDYTDGPRGWVFVDYAPDLLSWMNSFCNLFCYVVVDRDLIKSFNIKMVHLRGECRIIVTDMVGTSVEVPFPVNVRIY